MARLQVVVVFAVPPFGTKTEMVMGRVKPLMCLLSRRIRAI